MTSMTVSLIMFLILLTPWGVMMFNRPGERGRKGGKEGRSEVFCTIS